MKLSDYRACLQGIYPSSFYTCSKDGVPNSIYLSHIHYVDEDHVAISGQFLNKTRKNLRENPKATAVIINPPDILHVELELDWLRSETSGPIFETVEERLNVIHSQIGQAEVFKLQSIELLRVTNIRISPEYHHLLPNLRPAKPFSFQNLQKAMKEIQGARTLEELYDGILASLHSAFGFRHSILLVPEANTDHLVTIATHGYDGKGIGAEVKIGEGIAGKVAQDKKPYSFMGLKREFLYAQASLVGDSCYGQAIEMPTLTDALSQIAIPLLCRNELMGVLKVESLASFDLRDDDEDVLMTFGNYAAMAIENFQIQEQEPPKTEPKQKAPTKAKNLHVAYYREDESLFIDGEYLIRNLPAKILWKLLSAYHGKNQQEFSNRELRLDPSLKLPEIKDNLETRLILLKKRLEKKCPEISMTSSGRGKFILEVNGTLTLEERA